MSPEDKRRLVVISGAVFSVFLLLLVLSYIPAYLYILFITVGSGVVYFHRAEELQLFERLGLNPRRGLSIPPALLRWLPGSTLSGVPAGRTKTRKSDARNSFASPSDRHFSGPYLRREQTLSDTVFSPRDLLMGSYLAKPEESPSGAARAAGGSGHFGNPREQLRERLARPNHAAHTPNRRLSFGEPMGTVNRFTITPHRHYPIQQAGTSPVGVMPPAKWDGLRKNVLTQRNSPTVNSPVTVKIARPDPTRSSFFNHLNSPGVVTSPGIGAQADPCSRETVLSVLRESRKREVDEEDKCASGQKSKRRRNDSGGSSQSAFESFLANGAPSQLVPKPGNLKRGMNSSVLEESTMKRSRTSSISSVSGGPIPSGVPGSVRNPIRSSYSSSQGYAQRRAASSLSLSPFTSPGGSRCQTPERTSKKAREDDAGSPSVLKTDKETSDPAPATAKFTPKSEAPIAASPSGSGGSGKRKRKIQLVTTNRGDEISLPPPPELGYAITVKDLDNEKKAALTLIQKVLEEPEPENPAPVPTSSLFSNSSSSSESAPASKSTPLLLSLSKPVPLTTPAATTAPAPTIDLTVTTPGAVSTAPLIFTSGPPVTSTPAAPSSSISNPLLESLKTMKNNPLLNSASLLGAALTTPAPALSIPSLSTPAASTNATGGVVKSESGTTVLNSLFSTPSSISTPAPKPATSMPSAFAQILAQPLQPTPSSTPSLGGGGSLFGLIKPVATSASQPPASTAAPPTAAVGPTVSTNSISHPLSSGFKPIFGAVSTTPATTAEVKPTQPTFKPIFGTTTQSSSVFGQTVAPTMASPAAPATQPSSLFGELSNTQPPATPASSAVPTQAPSQSLFGGWNATTTSAPTANSTFQFGAAATTTAAPALNTTTAGASGTTSAFQFAAVKPASAPQPQNTFTFGQLSTNQNPSSTPFGGFSMATTTSTAPTTQTTFGSSSFAASASPFPAATQQTPGAPKPFTFGSNSSSGATQFGFGAAASTAPPAFGTNSQPTFGRTSSGFSFGNTTTPSVTPAFGASTQTSAPLPAPASTFSFGVASTGNQNPAPSTPAPPSGGFSFGAQVSVTPYGTPGPATQTPGFSFGANTDNKPAFGTSTPTFGQGSAGISMPFGSPGTPGFGAVGASPFGASPATFSIGTGSKPSGQRRLQARRQQRKK